MNAVNPANVSEHEMFSPPFFLWWPTGLRQEPLSPGRKEARYFQGTLKWNTTLTLASVNNERPQMYHHVFSYRVYESLIDAQLKKCANLNKM